MSDLTTWLLARIAEDEAGEGLGLPSDFGPCYDCGGMDPARVLAQCAALRAVVERYEYLIDHGDTGDADWVLCTLAEQYADHPDYREEWKP